VLALCTEARASRAALSRIANDDHSVTLNKATA